MTVGVKAETQILLGLIALFSIAVAVSLWRDQPPVITAICGSLMVRACLYWDEHGLVLRVKPSGYKQWIQQLFIHGKRRELGLDSVRLVTLAEARDAALANRKVARAGGDPRKTRQRSVPTFEQAAAKVFAMHRTTWTDKHAVPVGLDAPDVRRPCRTGSVRASGTGRRSAPTRPTRSWRRRWRMRSATRWRVRTPAPTSSSAAAS